MRRWTWFLAAFLILLASGGTLFLLKRPAGPLQIVAIRVPGRAYASVDNETTAHIEYTLRQKGPESIEVEFNQPVRIAPGTTIMAIQNGHYLPIRPHDYRDDQGEPAGMIYAVRGNSLLIRSTLRELPPGLLAIRLGQTITDREGHPLATPLTLYLSSAYPSIAKLQAPRAGEPVAFPAVAGHSARVGYVMQETPLFSRPGDQAPVRTLPPGTSFELLEESGAMAKVRIYYRQEDLESLPAGDHLIESIRRYTTSLEGYVPTASLHRLPPPRTPGAVALVSPGPVLRVFLWPGAHLYEELHSPVGEADIRRLEWLALLEIGSLTGNKYYSESFDSKRNRIPFFGPANGMEISQMSRDEFIAYQALSTEYMNRLASAWDAVVVDPYAEPLKRELTIRYFQGRRALYEAWLDWVRSDPSRTPQGLIDRILAVLPEGDRPTAAALLQPVQSSPSDTTYFAAMTELLSRLFSSSRWVEYAESTSRPPSVDPPTCTESPRPLELLGARIGEPATALMERLGPPTRVTHVERVGSVVYEYQKATMVVGAETGTLRILEVSEGAPEALREVLPGIRLGAGRDQVRRGLAAIGYCLSDWNAEDFSILRNGQTLSLDFEGDRLVRVRLAPVGEP